MTAELPPDDATLRRFLLGDLPPADLEAVALYLDAHPSVATTLSVLKADDTLVSALRGPADATDPPEVAAAVARAAALVGGEPTTASRAPAPIGDATADAVSDAVAAVTDADDADDPLAALAPPEAAGELGRLGGYRVLRLLGRGGMGAVFEAADDRLARRVALKVMLPALAAKASARQRFLREAKAAAAVEHDHIVPIYQTGEDRGVPFLAMPLLAGETLDARLTGARALPAADVLRIGREVAEGLAAAHAAGLVHRDIKPSNVWLERTADGAFKRVRILDFGLARSATGADGLTQSGAVLGTPAYMAPEQARGEAVDARADLFSLGVVLYHAATGRRPFLGNDTFSVLTALATTDPQPAATVNPAVPAGLSALITRLLAKNPAGRPTTARAVADELARLAADPPRDSATQVIAVGSADRSGAGGDTTEAFDATPPRRRARRGWKVAAAVLFLAVAGLAAANGPTIVRVVTNEGELVVEVDDPATEVTVKGGAVELRREEGGKKRVYLVTATKAGEVEVREPGSDAVLVTEKFQLRRGGDVLVKVTADKLAAARRKSSPADTPRAALDWVLAGGGSLRVAIDGKHLKITAPEQLPVGQVVILELQVPTATDDSSLDNIRVIPTPTGAGWLLDLRGTKVTAAGLGRLASFPVAATLDQLRLSETVTTDDGLAQVKRLEWVRNLDVRNTRVTDTGLAHLRGLKLEHLDLAGCEGVTGTGFTHLRGMTTLRTLDIYSCPVPGERLAELNGLKLESFSAGNCRTLGDAGLTHLSAVASLKTLGLSVTNVTDAGVKGVQDLRGLTTLDLGYNPGVTDASAGVIATLPALESLSLARTGLTDSGLERLAACKTLGALDIRATAVTAAGVRAFEAARPTCKVQWDGAPAPPAREARP